MPKLFLTYISVEIGKHKATGSQKRKSSRKDINWTIKIRRSFKIDPRFYLRVVTYKTRSYWMNSLTPQENICNSNLNGLSAFTTMRAGGVKLNTTTQNALDSIHTTKAALILKTNWELNMSRKCPTCEKTVYMGERWIFSEHLSTFLPYFDFERGSCRMLFFARVAEWLS